MSNEIALDVTCSDPEACAAMAADPLIRHVATPRWFNEVRATQLRLRASATLLKVPTFMPVPGDDRLVDSAAAIAFARAAGPIVDLKVYEKLFHELYLETDRDVVIADVVDWLTRILQNGSVSLGRTPTRAGSSRPCSVQAARTCSGFKNRRNTCMCSGAFGTNHSTPSMITSHDSKLRLNV